MTLYEKLSIIVSAAMAIATFAAVIVALWQTKYINNKKLKCSFIDKNTVVNSISYDKKLYVAMSISNIGNKKVVINNWGIKLKDSFILILTEGFGKELFDKLVSVKTPYVLEPEENVVFFYDKKLFIRLLNDNINNKTIDPNSKIMFVIHDSTGKSYTIRSKYNAGKYIQNNDNLTDKLS